MRESAVTIVAKQHTEHLARIATALETIASHIQNGDKVDLIQSFEENSQPVETKSKDCEPPLKAGDRVYTLHTDELEERWRGLNGEVFEAANENGELRVKLDDGTNVIILAKSVVKSGTSRKDGR